jgi:hypothetical protein
MPSRRTILSIVRTVVYVVLTIVLAMWHAKITGFGDAVLAGALLGDYLTWAIWSILELPENLLHGSYEAGVNLVFGILLFRLANFDMSSDLTGELAAVMFLACLLVGGVKSFCLGVVFAEKELEDDE